MEIELRRKFEAVGRVDDAPAKRDVKGNRFGFDRFVSRGDSDRLLDNLNSIWIESYVIRAFLARFKRTPARVRASKDGVDSGGRAICKGVTTKPQNMRAREGTYVEVLKGRDGLEKKTMSHEKNGVNLMQFQSKESG